MFQMVWGVIKFRNAMLFIVMFLLGVFSAGAVFAEEGAAQGAFSERIYSFGEGGLQLYRSEGGDERLTLGGEMITRYAYWNWFEAPSDNNEYSYGFQRTRLNLKFDSKYLNIFVQPQYVYMFGLPDDAVSSSPRGPLGMGGLYYLHNQDEDPYKFGLHQAYLQFQNIGEKDVVLKIGRFEYCDCMEIVRNIDGQKLNTDKNMRLGDRMLSSFGWSAFGRSFDGALVTYDNDKVNITSSFFYPTQGGWEKDSNETIEDIKIATATVTFKKGMLLPGAEVAGFYYNYQDDRNVTQRVDNSGLTLSSSGVDIDIQMFGGHFLGVYDVSPGQLDVLFWGGGQFGNWYELDQRAFALDAEVGYQFVELPWKPWLRAGYYYGSGDDDSADGDHGTFFQMAPGTRKYQLLPFCDLMNTEDIFFQLITKPFEKLTARFDYHFIRLTESDDRWYMGSGPTQEKGSIFGYIARPTHGEDDLAQELDLIVDYKINPQLNLILSYSHIFGGDVIEKIYIKDDSADYVSLEARLKF
jgi:hypothetical protein